MRARMLGKADVNFTSDRGDRIEGTTIYYSHKSDRVEGQAAGKVFIPVRISLPSELKPNDTIDIDFNQSGKVEGIRRIAERPAATVKAVKAEQ